VNLQRLVAAAALVLAGILLASPRAQAQEIKVTLLGTGSPAPAMNRFGPSILVEAGPDKFLFDAGRGAFQRLTQAKVRWQDIDAVFFTHLHSDHTVGFPDLWLSGWLVGPGRNRELQVYGPSGTRKMMGYLRQAYGFDIRFRESDDRAPAAGVLIRADDIAPGVVLDRNGVKVTAFEVDHFPVKPAFGYRIDYQGRSVVLSGDTRFSENLIEHAQDVDLLIHEVASPSSFLRAGVSASRTRSVVEHHITPEKAGEVFARTRPRLAVYSHIVQPGAAEQELLVPTRSTYQGPVVVGEDLMVIDVGATVQVHRADAAPAKGTSN
jgi:ribonuclease Z